MTKALVVIPAWNEEQSLGPVLRELAAVGADIDLLVVDDGSIDGTRDAARAEGVSVLSLPFNLGVGGAMRAGFRYAQRSGYPVVVQVDADGQHDPSDIPRLLAALESADVVIGARFAGVGDYDVKGPRRLVMRVLSFTLSRKAQIQLTDVTSGFRATGPRAIGLFAATYPAEYLGDTVESLTLALKAGLTVNQVPVSMRPRSHGVSSASPFKAVLYTARALVTLLLAVVRAAPDPALIPPAVPQSKTPIPLN